MNGNAYSSVKFPNSKYLNRAEDVKNNINNEITSLIQEADFEDYENEEHKY